MAATQGQPVNGSDYNALFTTLEAIRAKHVAQADISNTNKRKLQDTTLGGNVVSVSNGTEVLQSQIQSVFNAMDFLDDYASALSGFASKITVPKAGDLLKATTITSAQTQLNSANKVCAFCNFDSSFDSSFDSGFSSGGGGGDCGFSSNGSWNSSWSGVVC